MSSNEISRYRVVERGKILEAVGTLHPSIFEQLTYDLLVSMGLRNAVWRTPGPDGGRDIEGEYPFTDLSGSLALQRWYIECKRYAGSVDWPTVSEKLGYAVNHDADYLFMVTTAVLTPRCKEEVARHNASRRATAIRFWEGHDVESMLLSYPHLLVKYGLPGAEHSVGGALLPLVSICLKAVQASYGIAFMLGGTPSRELELATALSELLMVRLEAAEEGRPVTAKPFSPATDSYPWMTVEALLDLSRFDGPGLRALLTGYRFYAHADTVMLAERGGSLRISGGTLHGTGVPPLQTITFWSLVRITVEEDGITLEPHEEV
jgi:hypothetical protein